MHVIVKISLILLLGLTAAVNNLCAQPQQYSVQNYTEDDGIPQTVVDNIGTDSMGMVWLSTQNGLTCFDGRRFQKWDIDLMKSRGKRFLHFSFNPDDRKFYAMTAFYNELIRVDGFLPHATGVHVTQIFSALELLQGNNPWLDVLFPTGCRRDLGNQWILMRLNADTAVEYDDQQLVFYNAKGRIATVPFPYETYCPEKSRHLNAFFIWNSALYVCTKQGIILKITPGGIQEVPVFADGATTSRRFRDKGFYILSNANSDKNLFIADGVSLYRIDSVSPAGMHIRTIFTGFNFAANHILHCIHNPANGQFLFCGHTTGLFVIQPNAFTNLYAKSASNIFTSLLEGNDGTILSTLGDVLQPQQPGLSSYLPLLKQYSDKYSITRDGLGRIWVKTIRAVSVLTPDGRRLIHSLPVSGRVSCLRKDELSNGVWVGTLDGDLFKIECAADGTFLKQKRASGMKDMEYIMQAGDLLWLGTFNGLYRYSIAAKTIHSFPQLKDKYIRSVYCPEGAPGDAWVTTEGAGLFKIKGDKVYPLPGDKMHHLDNAHAILADAAGYYWISTNNGLFQVAQKDMEAAALEQREIYYHCHNKEMGFASNEFNGGENCALKLSNGMMAFSGMKGVVCFNPARIKPVLPDAPVYLQKVTFGNNISIAVSDTITWSDRKKRMKLTFTTPYYGNSNNLYFSYSLDNDFINHFEKEELEFNELSKGYHTITVFKKNGFGAGNASSKKLVIYVTPYWFETAVFKGLIIVALLLLVILLIHFRLRFLKRQNQKLSLLVDVRTRELHSVVSELEVNERKLTEELFFQNLLNSHITHNIRTPLRFLAEVTARFTGKADDAGSKSDQVNRQIGISVKDILATVDNLTLYIKARGKLGQQSGDEVALRQMMERLFSFFGHFQHKHQVYFQNDIPEQLVVTTQYELLRQLCYNLIDNAVKHAQATRISVTAYTEEEHVRLILSDDGIGMPSEELILLNRYFSTTHQTGQGASYQGIGMRLIRELIPVLGISLRFEGAEKGVRIIIDIPVTETKK
jgi:signal transduction histidine kinase